jgi:hypothetical protein
VANRVCRLFSARLGIHKNDFHSHMLTCVPVSIRFLSFSIGKNIGFCDFLCFFLPFTAAKVLLRAPPMANRVCRLFSARLGIHKNDFRYHMLTCVPGSIRFQLFSIGKNLGFCDFKLFVYALHGGKCTTARAVNGKQGM